MFYVTVEQYTMQNRRRELAKELKIKRQLPHSPISNSGVGLRVLAEAGGRLRNLVHVFTADTSTSFHDETPLDCVAC
jgi:hypothetical protein